MGKFPATDWFLVLWMRRASCLPNIMEIEDWLWPYCPYGKKKTKFTRAMSLLYFLYWEVMLYSLVEKIFFWKHYSLVLINQTIYMLFCSSIWTSNQRSSCRYWCLFNSDDMGGNFTLLKFFSDFLIGFRINSCNGFKFKFFRVVLFFLISFFQIS